MPRRNTDPLDMDTTHANGEGVSPAKMEAQAERLSQAARKKKQALKELAETQDMEQELMGSDSPEADVSPDQAPMPGGSRIEQIVAELQGEGTFEVFHIGRNGQPALCGKFPVTDWPDRLETIAQRKGGGTFKVTFRNPQGYYAGQFTQTFDSDTYGEHRPQGGSGDPDTMSRFLEMMERKDAEHRREMSEMRLEMMRLQTEMVKSLTSQGQNGMFKTAQDLKVLSEVLGGGQKDKRSLAGEVKEYVEMLNMLKDSEAVTESDPLSSAIEKAFKYLGPLLQAGAQRLAGGASVQGVPLGTAGPALPAPASPVSPPQSAAPACSEDAAIVGYAAHLKTSAATGADAVHCARYILSCVEDPKQYDDLKALVNRPGIVDSLMRADAGLVPYKGWVESFIRTMQENIKENDEAWAVEAEAEAASPEAAPKEADGLTTDPS